MSPSRLLGTCVLLVGLLAPGLPARAEPAWTASGLDRPTAWFGWSVAGAGDVNGDGYGDVLVSAPWQTTASTSAGKAYLYLGRADGLEAAPSWSSSGDDHARVYFGWSVAGAGDVNGDGYDDVIVGAPAQDDAGTDSGKVFLFYGSRNSLAPTAGWTATGAGRAQAFFGTAVCGAGDVNGDGYDDLLVGAPAASFLSGPTSDSGMAFLYLGGPGGPPTTAAWTSPGEAQAGAAFGWSAAGLGDTNGDGYDDVLIGACLFDTPVADAGRAYLFLGSATGLQPTPAWSESGDPQTAAQFGWSVGAAGDLNRDGFADAVIGAPGHDTPQSDAGRAYVYLGGQSTGGLNTQYLWRYSGTDRPGAQYGWSVAGAGDANGDGADDLLVGAPGDDTQADSAGRAFLYLGSVSGPVTPPSWSDSGDGQAGAGFGAAVASAGDANGDGLADLLLGAYAFDTAQTDAGRAYLFLGSGNGGPCQPAGSACDDGDDCTRDDSCTSEGLCRGTPFVCQDDNPCTDDLCRPDGSCAFLHRTGPCDDGDACTTPDTCAAGVCQGQALDCSFLDDQCRSGACDPASGTCQPRSLPDGTPCDDGDSCTGEETCQGGLCIHHQDLCPEGGSCGCGARGSPAAVGLLAALLLWRRRR